MKFLILLLIVASCSSSDSYDEESFWKGYVEGTKSGCIYALYTAPFNHPGLFSWEQWAVNIDYDTEHQVCETLYWDSVKHYENYLKER